jgi:hypothetical protein
MQSEQHMLVLRFTAFDPEQTWAGNAAARCGFFLRILNIFPSLERATVGKLVKAASGANTDTPTILAVTPPRKRQSEKTARIILNDHVTAF